ncbi:hypothetical protein GQ53DRAFT_762623 [Thozetella sp. PMI_491]|nr:hypothetical protein GQ53DRAFT_762623 [Thozetella sp. PMI_491]
MAQLVMLNSRSKTKRAIPAASSRPYFETIREHNIDFDDDDDIIAFTYRYLTLSSEESDRTLFQMTEMTQMCPRVSLNNLLSRRDEGPQRLVAWVDERNTSGETRSGGGPHTAYQLYRLLATTKTHRSSADWVRATGENPARLDGQLQESHNWLISTMGLLAELLGALDETILVWNQFSAADLLYLRNYVLSGLALGPTGGRLAATERSFNELRLVYKHLEHLEFHCAEFAKAIALSLSLERTAVMARQQKSADYGRVVTVVTLLPLQLSDVY